MKHKGKQQYSGAEISNVGLGQSGWIWTNPAASDIFHASDGTTSSPNFYYSDVQYWCGVKCYATTDSAAGNTLCELKLTPLDTNLIDQSKADNPGSAITVKLQSGQSIFGAFKKVEVSTNTNCSLIIYKG